MIDLDKDPSTFVTEQDIINLIDTALGEGTVTRHNAGYYVFMNMSSPDMEFRPGLRLKDLMSKSRYEPISFIRVRLIADLINIYDVFGGPFEIVEGFKSKTCRTKESKYEEDWHRSGNAVDIKPIKKSQFRDLIRASRFAKQKGGRGFYPNYIHLDCGYNKMWTVGKDKKAD